MRRACDTNVFPGTGSGNIDNRALKQGRRPGQLSAPEGLAGNRSFLLLSSGLQNRVSEDCGIICDTSEKESLLDSVICWAMTEMSNFANLAN